MAQIILENFHNGGLASTTHQLSANTLFRAEGFDMQSEPGILKTNLLLAPDLVIPQTVNKILFCSDGNAYIFGNSGYIRKRTIAGVYSQPYTTPGWTTEDIMNAVEFNGYIYFCSPTTLYRYQIGAANWDGIVAFATFAVGNTAHHPMFTFLDQLYIGDGRYVHNVDQTGTYNSAVFDAKPPNVITCMISNGYSLLIGTTKTTDFVNSVYLYEWDMVSPDYCNTVYTVNESIINGMFFNGDTVLISAGYRGSIYQLSGLRLQKIEQLSLDIDSTWSYTTATIRIRPNTFFEKDNIGHFGVSYGNGQGTIGYGIYSLGNQKSGMPIILCHPFMLSGTNAAQPAITACAYEPSTNTILVAWNDQISGEKTIDAFTTGPGTVFFRQKDWRIQTGWITNSAEIGKQVKLTIPYRTCADIFVVTGVLTGKNGTEYPFDLIKDEDRQCFYTTVSPDSIYSFFITLNWTTTGNNIEGFEIEKIIIDII